MSPDPAATPASSCICDSMYGMTCAMHAYQAAAVARGEVDVDQLRADLAAHREQVLRETADAIEAAPFDLRVASFPDMGGYWRPETVANAIASLSNPLPEGPRRPWPPSGYLCLVGGDECRGHRSKWLTCATDPAPQGD